jgi:hypothetical protein
VILRSIYDHREPDDIPDPSEVELGPAYLPPYMVMNQPKPPAIVPGLCYESSVGILVAEPHVGKTLLVLDLAIAMAARQSWLKWQPVSRVPTLMYALDSPGWESAEQAQCLMAGRSISPTMSKYDPFFLVNRDSIKKIADGRFNIMEPLWYEHLRKTAGESKAKLIALDSFKKIHNFEENDNAAMDEVMERLAELARETGAFVLLLHHTPVISRSDTAYAGRGAGAITASTDFAAVMTKTDKYGVKLRILKGRGSDDADEDTYITKTRVDVPGVTRAVRWEVAPPKEERGNKLEEAWTLIKTELATGPKTRLELQDAAEGAGLSVPGDTFLNNYLTRFRQAGLVESLERGKWSITKKGNAK